MTTMSILSQKKLKTEQASALAAALGHLNVAQRNLSMAKDRVALAQSREKEAEAALAAVCKEEGIDLPAGASVRLVHEADGSVAAVVSKADEAKHDAPKPKPKSDSHSK
jgi:hypothetical protein